MNAYTDQFFPEAGRRGGGGLKKLIPFFFQISPGGLEIDVVYEYDIY